MAKTQEKQTMKFKIIALSANDKATEWTMKIKNPDGLAEAKCQYAINIKIDDDFFAKKIDEKKQEIKDAEAEPDLFNDFKAAIKELNNEIKAIEAEKKSLDKLSIPDFNARVTQADFTKSTFILEIPESVIMNIINIRHNVEAFVVELK